MVEGWCGKRVLVRLTEGRGVVRRASLSDAAPSPVGGQPGHRRSSSLAPSRFARLISPQNHRPMPRSTSLPGYIDHHACA